MSKRYKINLEKKEQVSVVDILCLLESMGLNVNEELYQRMPENVKSFFEEVKQ